MKHIFKTINTSLVPETVLPQLTILSEMKGVVTSKLVSPHGWVLIVHPRTLIVSTVQKSHPKYHLGCEFQRPK